MSAIADWLDHRIGYRSMVKAMLYEPIPGGARWRYVWGSTLVFSFSVQVITGLFLWMGYSPSAQTAWESVYYIQHEAAGGWLLRGIHHFTAQAMIVLLALHVMQVVIDGAYRAPREVNFWIGLLLLQIVMGLSLTGYLLPWDQKGFWATKVATSIMAIVPVIGPSLQRVVVGGADYGHHTLTRFFALHAGLLPGALVAFLIVHVYAFRRHGINAKQPKRKPDTHFWPDQVLMDAVACLAVLVTVILLTSYLGADLGAPADPTEPYAAARPEWYFLFLFQFLKYFPGKAELWGAIVIPGLVMFVLFLMPFVGRWRRGHMFNIGFVTAIILGAASLTGIAVFSDRANQDYQHAVSLADAERERTVVLVEANEGIPPEGAIWLLRNDPKTMGPRLFQKRCATCHRFGGHDGTGKKPTAPQTASDLKGIGSRAWLQGLFDPQQIATAHYFGATKYKEGKMIRFVTRDVAKYDDTEKAWLAKVIKTVSAEANLPAQLAMDQRDLADIKEGRTLLGDDGLMCLDCHRFHGEGAARKAPDLTGYGSFDWLVAFIYDPGHERFYGDENADGGMPTFGKDGILDRHSIELIAHWLRGEWYESGDSAAPQVSSPIVAEAPPAPPTTTTQTPAPVPTVAPAPAAPDVVAPAPAAPDVVAPAPVAIASGTDPGVAALEEVPDKVDFVKHIKPILEARCVKCHSPPKPKGDYRLDIRAGAFSRGASDEPTIEPGESQNSLLYKKISTKDVDERMPAKGKPLTPVQIATIKKWIDDGADWPKDVVLKVPPKDGK